MKRICISSGHSTKCQGAIGILNEVEEATRITETLGHELRHRGIDALTFSDTISTTQNENLNRIVDWHNSHARDLDISVHLNSYNGTAHGTEVCYLTQSELAAELSAAIAAAGGFTNRGGKYRDDLFVLSHTSAPCVLLEIMFLDNASDVSLYEKNYGLIIEAIADTLCDDEQAAAPKPKRGIKIPDNQRNITASMFGGEDDYNVSAYDEDKVLNDTDFYVALPDRFEGDRPKVLVINRKTGEAGIASIEDVGPWNIDDPYWTTGKRPQAESGTDMTGRETNGAGIDLSPALAALISIDGMGTVDWDFVED